MSRGIALSYLVDSDEKRIAMQVWPKTMALWVAAVLCVALPVLSQDVPSAPGKEAAKPFGSTATLILVPTLVRSASGDLVQGLVADDFRLTDNGVEQRVRVEEVERQPISVVVLLQIGGAAARQFPNYHGLDAMLEYMMGSSTYKATLLTFDSQVEESWRFSSHFDRLKAEFDHPEAGDDGAAIVDAVSEGIDLLAKRPAMSRRIIVLFSQPYDEGSKAKAEDVVRRLGENNITIYSVIFSPEKAWLKDQFTKPRHENPPYVLTPGEPPLLHTFNLSEPLSVALKAIQKDTAAEIATLSGGEQMRFDEKRDLDNKLGLLANHVAGRYTLSFQPSVETPGFHEIKVRLVNHAEATEIAARSSYWYAAYAGVP